MSLRVLSLAALVLVVGWTSRSAAPPARRATTYIAQMTGGNETPANTAAGTGSATFTLDGTMLKYSISVKGLSGPATAAHIHVGATGVSGPPVYTFQVKAVNTGALASGTIDLAGAVSTGVSGDSLKKLLTNGTAYVNVHTAKFPGGEIRGQVMRKQ